MQLITSSAQETKELGTRVAGLVKEKDILCLFGQLGSGKTTFVKGLAKGLGVKQIEVNSPSFILMRKYSGRLPLFHFDLYRIKSPRELCNIGYEEFIFDAGVAVIEWADKMEGLLPQDYLKIEFFFLDSQKRRIKLSASHKHYRDLLKKI